MSRACIIPCKPYERAKTRLAPCLTREQRVRVSRHVLLRTISLARTLLDTVIVVSRGSDLLAEAANAGAVALVEEAAGLNLALSQAANFASVAGATGVLVLPADLPVLTASDIAGVLALADTPPAVVIAPCRHEAGTNALLVSPPQLISFAFGRDSFARHRAAAVALGIQPAIYRSPTIAFDLDTPEDWQAFCQWPDLAGANGTIRAATH